MIDEQLDYYGRLYTGNNIGEKLPGVTFTKFLQSPDAYLSAVAFNLPKPIEESGDDFYPLLPAQLEVAGRVIRAEFAEMCAEMLAEQALAKLLRDCAQVRLRGNAYIEPLRHHRYGTNRDRDIRRIPR